MRLIARGKIDRFQLPTLELREQEIMNMSVFPQPALTVGQSRRSCSLITTMTRRSCASKIPNPQLLGQLKRPLT